MILICMRRRKQSTGSSAADLPTRRVTVRRGRVVPASHYLSLTGSKFGLNAFEEDARTTRSKSPFEWWNTLKEKRRSQHLDDISQIEAGDEGMSQTNDIYTRREYSRSQTSLNNAEKAPVNEIQEVEPAEPSPTFNPPTRHTSFSRPFQIPQYASDSPEPTSPMWSSRRNRNLSMIKEAASPHTSMVSARSLERRSSRLSAYNPGEPSRQDRRPSGQRSESSRASNASQRSQRQRSSPSEGRRPSDTSQRQRRSPPDNLRPGDYANRRPSDRSSASLGSQQHIAPYPNESWSSIPRHSSQEEVPRPVAYRGSRHSLGEQEANSNGSLSKRSSVISRHDSLTDRTEMTRRPSRPKSLVLDDSTRYQQQQGPEYWAGRAEMMPEYGDSPVQPPTPTTPTSSTSNRAPSIGRASSKKGNVLRKKSLKRQEMVSYVGA